MDSSLSASAVRGGFSARADRVDNVAAVALMVSTEGPSINLAPAEHETAVAHPGAG